eukprot:COSAG01_NODE_836_length_13206_cov_139.627375_16_plen_95_part_00
MRAGCTAVLIALHNLHEELHHARPQYLMLSPDRVLMDVRAMRSIPTAVLIMSAAPPPLSPPLHACMHVLSLACSVLVTCLRLRLRRHVAKGTIA